MKLFALKQYLNYQGLKKYVRNTSILILEKILRLFIGLFVGIWMAKYLGPSQFGALNYYQSYVAILMPFAMIGLDSVVVKQLVLNRVNHYKILGTSFTLKVIGAIVALMLIFLSFFYSQNTTEEKKFILILSISLFTQSLNVIDFHFQSEVKSKYTVYSSLFSLILSSLLKIIFILCNKSIIWFIILIALESVLLLLGLIYYYHKTGLSIFKWTWDNKISRELLRQSWPLALSGFSFVIYNNVDKLMISYLLDDYSVGQYSASLRLVTVWHFLPGVIVSSFLPYLVEGHDKSKFDFEKRLGYLGSFLIWFSIILALTYTFFSEILINYTFGQEFTEASTIMIFLIWSNVFIFFNSLWNKWKLIQNKTRTTLYFALTTSFVNVALNYFLIQEYGALGASLALLIALTISSIFFYIILDPSVIKLFIKSLFFYYKNHYETRN